MPRLLPVPCVVLFRGQGCQVQKTRAGVCGLCEVFTRRCSFRSSTRTFRASHKSEKCSTTAGWVVPGGSHLWLRKQKQSRLHAGREAGGKQADESRSEKFSPRVLIGSIFRLQYLAGPIMQFIFPQEDTNDLANLFLWS